MAGIWIRNQAWVWILDPLFPGYGTLENTDSSFFSKEVYKFCIQSKGICWLLETGLTPLPLGMSADPFMGSWSHTGESLGSSVLLGWERSTLSLCPPVQTSWPISDPLQSAVDWYSSGHSFFFFFSSFTRLSLYGSLFHLMCCSLCKLRSCSRFKTLSQIHSPRPLEIVH